jgi:hypothetical protein
MDMVPSDPGYYAYDPDIGWVKFEHYADMLFFRVQHEPPLMVREVKDPAETLI